MNLFNLSIAHQIVLAVVVGGYLQILFALVCTQIPSESFDANKFPYKLYAWEKGGVIYQKLLIKRWKRYLPDAAQYVKGEFKKKRLASTEESYIRTFIIESCRVEWAHWAAMLSFVVFFALVSLPVAIVFQLYAIGVNLPCIWAQRYNRPRLARYLVHAKRMQAIRQSAKQ